MNLVDLRPPLEIVRPGPIYDAAMRGLMEGDPAAICRLLGLSVSTPDGCPEILSASFAFPFRTLSADSLFRIGPRLLAHVEYERSPGSILPVRMLGYRWAIMRRHLGDRLFQFVIVLGRGGFWGSHDPVVRRFWGSVAVIKLREVDPEFLLSEPGLAPLAALGRGDPSQREAAYARAIRVIEASGGSRARELQEFAMVLAQVTLPPPDVTRIYKESGVGMERYPGQLLLATPLGRQIKLSMIAEGRAEGLEAGREAGREEGREAGREEGREAGREEGREAGREEGRVAAGQQILAALLRDRFGEHPRFDAIAKSLATWLDPAAAVHEVTSTPGLDAFLMAHPSD